MNSGISRLQNLLNDFSAEASSQKISALKEYLSQKLSLSKKELERFHSQLLFLSAYPDNKETHELSQKCLEKISEKIRSRENLKNRLISSGIAGTATQSAFSLTLTGWMVKTFPGSIKFHSFDESGVHPKEVFKNYLSEAEFELALDEKLKPLKWLEKSAGTKNKARLLKWIVDAFDSISVNVLIKDQLFESLKLFIEIDPSEKEFSSTFGRVKTSRTFFHSEGILKKFSERELINKKLPPEKKFSEKEKKEIISAARIALMLLHRETDPVTYCEENSLKYFELERGLSIALFSIDSERRLPVESYIGFMMFKNGHPMSYGGAWLFGKRALIGINIFEAFRGGESAIVFANLQRCYKMAFGAEYFEVEPYQFGKNNPEGIKSGAFWFYYRFGYKPVNEQLRALSNEEHQKIVSTKGYRSSYETLKLFTQSNLFVNFGTDEVPLNPSDLSRFASQVITSEFSGDRKTSFQKALKLLKQHRIINGKENKTGLKKLTEIFAFCLDLSKLTANEKRQLSKMIDLKAQNEFEYIRALASFPLRNRVSPAFSVFVKSGNYPNLR
jgi:hypothetical protein